MLVLQLLLADQGVSVLRRSHYYGDHSLRQSRMQALLPAASAAAVYGTPTALLGLESYPVRCWDDNDAAVLELGDALQM